MLHRYRVLAREALASYELRRPSMSLVKFGENITWRVATDSGEAFLLRVHRPIYHTAAEVASELRWLQALHDTTELTVPEPVATRSGEPLAIAGDAQPHVCTLLRWIDGRHRWESPAPGHMQAVGRTMALLHSYAPEWEQRATLPRPVLDWNSLLSPSSLWGRLDGELTELFAEEDRSCIRRSLARIRSKMRELDATAGSRSLIHADLHFGNLVFAGRQVCPIDFDDCGFGYLAYDLATTLLPFHGTERFAALRDALLRGYSEVRRFPAEQVAALPEFLAARRLTMALWLRSRAPYIPRLPRDLGPYLASSAKMCRELGLDGERGARSRTDVGDSGARASLA